MYNQKIEVSRLSSGVILLTINGYLQLDSLTDPIYHETAIHGGCCLLPNPPKRALILGGGDGCAARELLKYKDIEKIVLVDIDEYMVHEARENPLLTEMNEKALHHEKVHINIEDARKWIRRCRNNKFDFIFADFPDPSNPILAKLYDGEFYSHIRRILRKDGVFVVQAAGLGMSRLHKFLVQELYHGGFKGFTGFIQAPMSAGSQVFIISSEHAQKAHYNNVPAAYIRYFDEQAFQAAFGISQYWIKQCKAANIKGIQDAFTAWGEDSILWRRMENDKQ